MLKWDHLHCKDGALGDGSSLYNDEELVGTVVDFAGEVDAVLNDHDNIGKLWNTIVECNGSLELAKEVIEQAADGTYNPADHRHFCSFCGISFRGDSEHTCEQEQEFINRVRVPLSNLGIPWEGEEPNVGINEMRESIRAERADDGN